MSERRICWLPLIVFLFFFFVAEGGAQAPTWREAQHDQDEDGNPSSERAHMDSVNKSIQELFADDPDIGKQVGTAYRKRIAELLIESIEKAENLGVLTGSEEPTKHRRINVQALTFLTAILGISFILLWQSNRIRKFQSEGDEKVNLGRIPVWIGVASVIILVFIYASGMRMNKFGDQWRLIGIFSDPKISPIRQFLIEEPSQIIPCLQMLVLPPSLFAIYNYILCAGTSGSAEGEKEKKSPLKVTVFLGITSSFLSIASSVTKLWTVFDP